jgi:cyclic pyranopterin phosphate synthase
MISAMNGIRDAHGREVGDLRVSVTDRCNFRCRYCMPADGMEWLDRSEILSFEEIERLVRVLVSLGIRDVRLTGASFPCSPRCWRGSTESRTCR